MRRTAGLLLTLAALLALPSARADGFDALEASAEKVDALEPFLSRFLGRCDDPYTRRACEQNLASARSAVAGKTFVVRVPDAATLVRADLANGRYVLLLTPFIDGGGRALTHGAPTGQDPAGHPRVGLIPIKGTLPPGTMDLEFQSPFRTGAVELEIVFRPERAWRLPRKGERGDYEGLAARFLGVRVVDGRTGAPIATKLL